MYLQFLENIFYHICPFEYFHRMYSLGTIDKSTYKISFISICFLRLVQVKHLGHLSDLPSAKKWVYAADLCAKNPLFENKSVCIVMRSISTIFSLYTPLPDHTYFLTKIAIINLDLPGCRGFDVLSKVFAGQTQVFSILPAQKLQYVAKI